MYPDVIVHFRGAESNFLVIEAKKKASSGAVLDDMKKLQGYTDPVSEGGLGYCYGALVVFQTNGTEAVATLQEWLAADGTVV